MSVRRLVSTLSVCLVAASATLVAAQPKNDPKAPVAPAKDGAPADPSAPPTADGAAVEMAEDPPPADMEGTDENPDAPKPFGTTPDEVVVPVKEKRSGYPIEEVYRPLTLLRNMSEVSISPHFQVSPYQGADALRARYGITREVQLGLTYLLGGVFEAPGATKLGFHPGKAVGVDVTVLLQDWIAVKVGVPVYIDPVAVGVTLAAPIKFQFGDKLALGGLDDLLSITISKFSPSLYQEATNAALAADAGVNTTKSRGTLRFSGYGIYQHKPKTAIIGRLGVALDDFSTNRTTSGTGGITTNIRVGVQHTPRKYLDVGVSLGFDDLAHAGTFSPAGYLAVRI